jgi:uncharacterized protein YndB with AHSA1/START domain
MTLYKFVDHWYINAPIDVVYHYVSDPRTYPEWWHWYDGVRVLKEVEFPHVGGEVELIVRSPFGYRLKLNVETAEADPPRTLKTISRGDLAGTGEWVFQEEGDTTHAIWTWIVESNHALLNRLEWLLKPVFAFSHVLVSGSGHRGLKKLLEREDGSKQLAVGSKQ